MRQDPPAGMGGAAVYTPSHENPREGEPIKGTIQDYCLDIRVLCEQRSLGVLHATLSASVSFSMGSGES